MLAVPLAFAANLHPRTRQKQALALQERLKPPDIVSFVETCYRHPGRETGVACSSCGRPICPDCMTPTPVGMRCPECSRQRTKVKTMAGTSSDPSLTYVLIGICVVLQLGSILSGAGAGSGGLGGSALIRDGGLSAPAVADGDVWRLVTAGFLHAGLPHLLFNMYALYILGSMLEPAVGRLRFGLIYFVSLLGGSLGALLVSPNSLTVGASGAIFGLMGATLVIMRSRGIGVMESGIGVFLGLNLLITFAVPGISIGGHLGGLAAGVICGLVLYELPQRVRQLPALAPTVLAGAIGVLAVVASLAVSNAA
jgi:membrane associated rhomboid family serine protease